MCWKAECGEPRMPKLRGFIGALEAAWIGDLAVMCRGSRMDIASAGLCVEEARPDCLSGRLFGGVDPGVEEKDTLTGACRSPIFQVLSVMKSPSAEVLLNRTR